MTARREKLVVVEHIDAWPLCHSSEDRTVKFACLSRETAKSAPVQLGIGFRIHLSAGAAPQKLWNRKQVNGLQQCNGLRESFESRGGCDQRDNDRKSFRP